MYVFNQTRMHRKRLIRKILGVYVAMTENLYTLSQYCELEKVSRSTVYLEWRRGEGVEFIKRGAKILISETARIAYREKLAELSRRTRNADMPSTVAA